MSEKRRDIKGRILRDGEVQRSDGRYMYRYTDRNGIRQTLYSWKLVATDNVPPGKKRGSALRELENEIQRDVADGIATGTAAQITVDNLFENFMDIRKDLRTTTRCNYMCIYNKHAKPLLGNRMICDVKNTDIQRLYISLYKDSNLKIGTIEKVNAILFQVFENAVFDSIIRKNPTEGVMKRIRKQISSDKEQRHALTEEQQKRFITYVYHSNTFHRFGPMFTVMLGTGMRIGEVLGLRLCDCNFEENIIQVTHELLYKDNEDGKYEYRISEPKTKSGYRIIPMFSDVRKALFIEINKKKNPGLEPFVVDGYKDFIFLNSHGKVFSPGAIFETLQRIQRDYNKEEKVLAEQQSREPCYLPRFSAHNLRHTFCTRLCENESNVKVVQDIMGHANSSTTMDVYNETTEDKKMETIQKLDGKIKLA